MDYLASWFVDDLVDDSPMSVEGQRPQESSTWKPEWRESLQPPPTRPSRQW